MFTTELCQRRECVSYLREGKNIKVRSISSLTPRQMIGMTNDKGKRVNLGPKSGSSFLKMNCIEPERWKELSYFESARVSNIDNEAKTKGRPFQRCLAVIRAVNSFND